MKYKAIRNCNLFQFSTHDRPFSFTAASPPRPDLIPSDGHHTTSRWFQTGQPYITFKAVCSRASCDRKSVENTESLLLSTSPYSVNLAKDILIQQQLRIIRMSLYFLKSYGAYSHCVILIFKSVLYFSFIALASNNPFF